ncbi:RE1 [Symbiodinium sp. CCMP2592]|nr:RE1 [Symbiodinium sp. CCMP2592]
MASPTAGASEAPQGGQSPGGASEQPVLTGEVVLNQLAAAVAQLAQATTSSGQSSSQWKETKYVKAPDLFNPKSLEEEAAQWGDWSFHFHNFMTIQDSGYRSDFEKCESASSFVNFADYAADVKERALRLYSVLASYLRGRPLKLLRANKNGDGYAVWRQLCDELQPRSRPRALALAQALSRFPPHKEGTSLLEYILGYERLIAEYEAVATQKYQEDLKISTLLAGLPQEVKRYMYLQVNDSTTYLGLREKLLQYKRTSSTWTAESMLKSLGGDFITDTDAMDVDRVADAKGKGKKGDKGSKGKPGKGDYGKKGEYGKKGNEKGWHRDGGKGYGKGSAKGGKGKKGDPGKKGSPKGSLSLVECWKCGKRGHYAAECRSRVNQVNQDDDAASVQTRATTSSATTASTAAPAAKAQVRRVHMVDLEQLDEDQVLGVEFLGSVRMVQEVDSEVEDELSCSSVQCFTIGSDNENEFSFELCSSLDLIADDSHYQIVVSLRLRVLSMFVLLLLTPICMNSFADVGQHSRESSFLLDAQGNRIPQGQVRTSVIFEVEGTDGEVIQFRDKAVLAQVRQPLFSFGKLLRDQWLRELNPHQGWCLRKDERSFGVHWSKNSLATYMRILRVEGECAKPDHEPAPPQAPLAMAVRLVVEISDDLEIHAQAPGWSLNSSMQPVHMGTNMETTFDGSGPYFFAAVIASMKSLSAVKFGKIVLSLVSVLSLMSQQTEQLANLKEMAVEERLVELRLGCRFLGISKNGSKSAVSQRLKKDVAHSKLQLEVAASEAVRAEFSRDPRVQALPVPPSPELVALHEVTHLPRADWCEACIAARSREDKNEAAGPKREFPVISLDFIFAKTDGEEAPLATHLVCVDSQSKYVVAVALASKGGKILKHAVEEVVGMLTVLGYAKVILSNDTEPSMKQLVNSIVAVRAKNNLATELAPVGPDSSVYGSLRSERYHQTVRNLGNCLLKTIEQRTGHKAETWSPLHSWAFVHAAFLVTRFHVHRDGYTSHELVYGRKYDQKLCPFGSAVYAQYLPKNKNKGEVWRQGVWFGRARIGNLYGIGDSAGIHFARTIRRPTKAYDVELLKTMRGTPYDFLLDVVPVRKKKMDKDRLPILVEAAPSLLFAEEGGNAGSGDEATSDPASSEAGGVGSMSVSLPGQSSGTDSSSSTVLILDAMDVEGGVNQAAEDEDGVVISAEGGLPAGHFEEEGFHGVPEDWSDIFEETWEIEGVLQEAERRKYEEGPPVLDADALAALDAEMDEVEIQRLLGMKVLEEIGPEEDVSDMYRLGCKNVRDWRFRNDWVRRSRLVAKEFRFLQPYMENLYSPTSLSSTQRLLAGLCSCNPQLRLYSGYIKDAYLTVKQRRKTYIVSNSGRMYRLHYNLPGQRAGARDWHEKLKAVLESDGLRAFEGAPALFYEPQILIVSTYIDDLQMLGLDARVQCLTKKIDEADLQFGVEGPCTPWSGECRFLKRKFMGVNGSIIIEQDGKHVEKLINLVGVERESGKQTPCPMNPNDWKSTKPLSSEKSPAYRTAIGILLYLGPDRPECLYTIKLLSAKTSNPTEHEWHLLRHLVRYLKLHPKRGISLSACNPGKTVEQRWLGNLGSERGPEADASKSFENGHLIESISDASWDGEADRRSINASVIFLNGNAVHVGNKRQKSHSSIVLVWDV